LKNTKSKDKVTSFNPKDASFNFTSLMMTAFVAELTMNKQETKAEDRSNVATKITVNLFKLSQKGRCRKRYKLFILYALKPF